MNKEDVAFISGGVSSGGSVKNWESVVEAGSVAIVSNVNKNIFEKEKTEDCEISVEIVKNEKPVRSKLLEEKKRLMSRVREINKLLKEEEMS